MANGTETWTIERKIPLAIVYLIVCQIVLGSFGIGVIYTKITSHDDKLASIEARLDRIENAQRRYVP